jgi:hypothetical protein
VTRDHWTGGILADAALEVFSEAGRPAERDNLLLIQEAFRLANERILTWASHNPEYLYPIGFIE